MGAKSQRRGKQGEYEVARLVNGIKVSRPRKRGVDVVRKYKRLKFLARTLEVKRFEKGMRTLYKHMDQAIEEGADALVMREDRNRWLVVFRLDDALEMEDW